MSDYVFRIRNLIRQFDGKIVVSVPKLDIERGKLVFLLGNSGCGKTTLLETLGLMSQAYTQDGDQSQIVFFPEPGSGGYDYNSLWLDEKKLNRVRLHYMSFLFQQTNLFPYFSAEENIKIAQVMQGKPINEEKMNQLVYQTMKNLGIGEKKDKKIKSMPYRLIKDIPGIIHFKLRDLNQGLFPKKDKMDQVHKDDDQAEVFKLLGNADYKEKEKEFEYWYYRLGDNYYYIQFHNEKVTEKGDQFIYPKELSGGQQQRTAFARASLKQFTVLFADEPTGNLGKVDAENVIQEIRKNIDKSNSKKTAIIVTHSISLAIKYADSLILMSQDGFVSPDHIFHKNEQNTWPELQKETDDLAETIQKVLDERKENRTLSTFPTIDVSNNYPEIEKNYDKEFKKFYYSKKFEDLTIKSINGLLLIMVLFIVWLSIGFSKGSLKYLEQKMSDPFIKWLNVDIPKPQQEFIPIYIDTLSSSMSKINFFVQEVHGYNRFALYGWDENRKGAFVTFGRTINVNDPILNKVMSTSNLIKGSGFTNENDYGIIISEEFVNVFFNENVKPFFNMSYATVEGDFYVPIPIRGIVKDLPGKNEFICTPFLYDQLFFNETNPLNPKHTKELVLFIAGVKHNAWALADSLFSFFEIKKKQYAQLSPLVAPPGIYEHSFIQGHIVRTSFLKELDVKSLNLILSDFKRSSQGKSFAENIERLYNHRFTSISQPPNFDKISINIGSLEKISELKNYLFQLFHLEIDMERIDSLKNYYFVTNLTNLLCIAIISICIISVSIFISYVLYIHLYKNRIYIGSFTAFGITDNTMQSIYLKKMTSLILSALVSSFILSSLIGYSGVFRELISIFFNIEDKCLYYNLTNFYPVLFLFVLFGTSYASLYYTTKYFLDHTPGDLIYDRIGKDRTSPPIHVQIREKNNKLIKNNSSINL